MPALLVYLLQANGALLLFVGVYYGLLRRLTFHQLNRWYLLGAVAFSALYPLVDASALLAGPVALQSQLTVLLPTWAGTTADPVPAAPDLNYAPWLLACYWAGVGILTVRLLVQALSLYRLHRASRPAAGGLFRQVPEVITPFSFGPTIYLNPAQHRPAELAAVLLHEQVHVRQWHTLDVLLGQAQRIFGWFNPAAWLLLRAVQENLEFIADQAVLETGQLDSKTYQYSLVRLSTLASGPALVIPFTFLPLKTRILMMNSPESAPAQASRYLLVLPLALGLLLSFSATKANPADLSLRAALTRSPADTEKPAPISALPPAALAHIVWQYPGYRLIGVSELRAADGSNRRYKAEIASGRRPVQVLFDEKGQPAQPAVAEPLYFLDGRLITKNEVDKLNPDAIASMNVLDKEEARKSLGATDGAILIITKKNKDSAEVQAFLKEHTINFVPPSPEVRRLTTDITEGRGLSEAAMQGRLLLINGKEATTAESRIAVGRVQGVYIMDAKKATEKFGDKGKNGAIIISTK